MKRYLTLALVLAAAVVFYMVGSVTGAVALVGVGLMLELGFWFGLISKRRNSTPLT